MAVEAGRAFVTLEYDPRSLAALGAKTRAQGQTIGGLLGGAGRLAGKALAIGVGAGAVAAGIGLAKAVGSARDFQTELNKLQAVSGATGDQMRRVSALSIQLGKDVHLPATSAGDAAIAMTELAKGGLSVTQAMKAARGTLQLAAAGEVDVGTAAQISANALNAFGLNGRRAGHVADLLAGAANASTGEISDFAEGLQFAGTASHAAGQSIDLTVASLAAMANAGLSGSVAGTSLANAMRALQAPTGVAAATMKQYGIDVFDSAGNMKQLDEIADIFSRTMGDLTQKQQTQALATIFGTRSVQAARIVFLHGGDALDAYRDKVARTGNAQRLAQARTKGFGGAVQAFGSNIETLGIQIGLKLLPFLTRAVRKMSDFVDFLGKIASAESPTVALHIVFAGIGSAVTDLVATLRDALFADTSRIKPVRVDSGKIIAFERSDNIGLVTDLRNSIRSAVQGVDWASVGRSIGGAIGGSIRITTEFVNTLVVDLIAAVNQNRDAIAKVGLGIGLSVVANLLDPGFWIDNWRAVAAIALGALSLAFAPEAIVARLAGIKVIGPLIVRPLLALGRLIRPAIVRLFRVFVEEFTSHFPAVTARAVALAARVVAGLRGLPGRVGGIFQDVAEGAVRALARLAADAVKLAVRIVLGILRPFISLAQRVLGPFRSLGTTIRNALGGLIRVAFDSAVNVGRGIINGIKAGVSQLAGSLKDAVVNVAKGALDGAKSFLHIGSPSLVFANEVGRPIVQGVIVGLNREQAALDKRIRALVKPAVAMPTMFPHAGADIAARTTTAGAAVAALRQASLTVTAPAAPDPQRFPTRFVADLNINIDGVMQRVQAEFRALDMQLAAGSRG